MAFEEGRQGGKGNMDMPDYRLVLFRHMDRVCQLFAAIPNDGKHQLVINIVKADAVKLMAALLKPYWDVEYNSEIEKLEKDDAVGRFAALTMMLMRKGFLPEEDTWLEEGG